MITRLQVRNFLSLRSVDVELGSLNVLVGSNMAGKSNILDVFRFLHQCFFPEAGTQGISYALAQRGGIGEVLWKGSDDKLITIVLEGVDDSEVGSKFKYELQLIAGVGDFVTIQRESLGLTKDGIRYDLIAQEQGFAKLKNMDGKDLGGVSSNNTSVMQYAAPGWDGFRFQQWAKLWRFYHLVPPVMKQSSLMSLGQVLQPNGDNVSAWLMWLQAHSPEAFRRVNEVLHDLFPEVVQINVIPSPDGKVHLATREKGLKRSTNVWQTSDGFIALTALLSLIYVPPELSGTVFCIEEPENHLHPRLLETLVRLLRQVRQEAMDAGQVLTQVLLTTQSPYLVDRFSLDEIIWVDKKDGATMAHRPADKSHLKKLIEDQDLGLGDLMFTGALAEDR
jgi:predicted ATPase